MIKMKQKKEKKLKNYLSNSVLKEIETSYKNWKKYIIIILYSIFIWSKFKYIINLKMGSEHSTDYSSENENETTS